MVIALAACQSVAQKPPAPPAPQAQRLLDEIAKSEALRTAEDKAAAKRLNERGDVEYRKGHYRRAFTNYMNSYPNYPNAHAYILSGDSRWRSVAQAKPRPGERCALDNAHFASDVRRDVVQTFQLGRALALARGDSAFMATSVYIRGGEVEACLTALADSYAAQPPSVCVDLDKLSACMGQPLLGP
jgi:hypothetical protein